MLDWPFAGPMPHLDLDYRLDYRWIGPPPGRDPVLVFLHHGLGSESTWRDLPDRAAVAAGLPALVYSRRGHGRSDSSPPEARQPDFMHREALDTLPRLLGALGVERPILVGHSDGGSISIIYAASGLHPRPAGLVLFAPHVFVEDCTVTSGAAALDDFETGTLRERLARHHASPEGVFRYWHLTWASDAFRSWNIEAEVGRVTCPMTIVQGLDDEYGTLEQVERIRRRALAPLEVALLEGCGHGPPQERPGDALAAIARMAAKI